MKYALRWIVGVTILTLCAYPFVDAVVSGPERRERAEQSRRAELDRAISSLISHFGTEQPVRKMMPAVTQGSEVSSKSDFSFFLVLGSASSSQESNSYSKPVIRFAWQDPKAPSEYIISEVDFSRVRVKLDDDADQPTASFKFSEAIFTDMTPWNGMRHMATNIFRGVGGYSGVITKYLRTLTIKVKPQDWPKNIHMPIQDQGKGK